MNFVRGSQALFFLAFIMTAGAHAQTPVFEAASYNPYPKAFLVSPQRHDYLAPAIYRSVNDISSLGFPVEIRSLCPEDIKVMIRKNLFAQKDPQPVTGLEKETSFGVGVEMAGNLKNVVRVGVGGKYDHIYSINTGPSQVIDSEDDNIGQKVLSKISNNCRDLIASHLKKRRVVFVAQAAIQAYDYDARIEDVTGTQVSVGCSVCGAISPEAKGSAEHRDKSRTSLSHTYVTFAMVPAEIKDRQYYVDYGDIGLQGTVDYREEAYLQKAVRFIRESPGRLWHEYIWARQERVQPQYAAQTTLRPRSVDPSLNTYAWAGGVQTQYAAQTTSRLRSVHPSRRVVRFAMTSLR